MKEEIKKEEIRKIAEMLSEIKELSLAEQAEYLYNRGCRQVPENSTIVNNDLLREVTVTLNHQIKEYFDEWQKHSKEAREWEPRFNSKTGMYYYISRSRR